MSCDYLERLALLKTLHEESWICYAFRRDPIGYTLAKSEQNTIASEAIRCGFRLAGDWQKDRYPINLTDECEALRLSLQEKEKPELGAQVLFAEFVEPSEVIIYTDCIRQAEKYYGPGLAEFLEGHKLWDLLLAHELFHFFEYQQKASIYTLNYRHLLWKFGPWRNASRLVCLSELAAASFVKTLQRLNFSPFLLDVLLTLPYNEEIGKKILDELLAINNGLEE